MNLAEGSVVLIQLQCGHGEKRVMVMEGTQKIDCPKCGRTTDIRFDRKSDGSFKMKTW